MLMNAKDFDSFTLGSPKLDQIYPSINYDGGQHIIFSNCDQIFVDFKPLRLFYENEVKRQRDPHIYWRDTSATNYRLGSNTFVDRIYQSDLPQYRSISLGVGSTEVNLIVDINGNFHLSFSYSGNIPSVSYGYSYAESYLCNNCHIPQTPSLDEITSSIDGICLGGGLVFDVGINIYPICTGLPFSSPLPLSSVSTFYKGSLGDIGVGASFTLPVWWIIPRQPKMGWDKILNEQLNGHTFLTR